MVQQLDQEFGLEEGDQMEEELELEEEFELEEELELEQQMKMEWGYLMEVKMSYEGVKECQEECWRMIFLRLKW